MSRKVSEPDSNDRKGLLRSLREHISHEWTSALLVTSLVTLAVHEFHWLKALETYAYLAIGNQVSINTYQKEDEARAIVVEIDQHDFEQRYRERSPLDRCILREDLQAIYDAKPDIVVVDLDLSPALSPWNACEDTLEELILERTSPTLRTVLLDPLLPESDSERDRLYRSWKESLTRKNAHISFADGTLPVNYGVLISPSKSGNSIAATTSTLAGRKPADRIDSRQLLTGLKVLTAGPAMPGDLKSVLMTWSESPKVVFFGGAYGSDDLFVTALGEVYGVEAHALAYVSREIDKIHIVDFAADLIMAMIFSIVIAFFWGRYFDARMGEPTMRELAKLWIGGLAACVVLFLLGFSWVSYQLLALGYWLSPIPIAIGMLIDSFVSGSVDQAVRKMRASRPRLPGDPTSSGRVDIDATETRNSPRLQWGARRLPRDLGGEICSMILARKPFAAVLLGVWMAIWMSAFLFAIRAH